MKINTDATSFGNGSLVPIDGVADSVSKKLYKLPFFVKKKDKRSDVDENFRYVYGMLIDRIEGAYQ